MRAPQGLELVDGAPVAGRPGGFRHHLAAPASISDPVKPGRHPLEAPRCRPYGAPTRAGV